MIDARGVAVSTPNRTALDHYEQALWQFHSYVGNPIETIDAALIAQPDFVLGHAFRATLLLLTSERQYLAEARASIERAEQLAHTATARERGLIRAARCWLEGDWPGACQAWEAVLVDHPRDALALQAAHLTDFYLGDAKNLADRVARVLPAWDEQTPSYSYILGMYAFGLEECNHYGRAEELGRRALALEPRDGWSVHAVTHVMEMQARFDEGIAWLRTRQHDWAPDNAFAFHNWWHLALYHLERADYAEILALYDDHIYPQASGVSLQMLDASALLWRLQLFNVDVGERWARLADDWAAKADPEDGYYAFNDVHALMAYLGAGRDREIAALLKAMERALDGPGVNAMMTREVGLPVARALIAFTEARYEEAIEQLAQVRGSAQRFGGSHAQRDLLNLTLIEAARRAGSARLAAHLLNERAAHKPHSPLTGRLRDTPLPLKG
jgi:hypothetical protein